MCYRADSDPITGLIQISVFDTAENQNQILYVFIVKILQPNFDFIGFQHLTVYTVVTYK